MAKDVCLSCAIDEAAIQWRQGGLIRFKERDIKGKGRMEDVFDVPERLESRRRLCVIVSLPDDRSSTFVPIRADDDDQDINTFLTTVQQELLEEELFGQVSAYS